MPRGQAGARSFCRNCGVRCRVSPSNFAVRPRYGRYRDWVFISPRLCPPCEAALTEQLLELGDQLVPVEALADGRMWPRRKIQRQDPQVAQMLRSLDRARGGPWDSP